MHVVLFEPQIPPNTGNVARTCGATGTALHLVRPLGFRIDDAALRRAGLDYWHLVDIRLHDSLQEVFALAQDARQPVHLLTKFGRRQYSDVSFGPDDWLIFGKETTGLPDWVHEQYGDRGLRLPMKDGMRSLNLSNTVAIVIYEALRQQGFPGLT